ncbi:MAG TPA: hypothetical protein VEM15_04260 [Thermodesulfobacteriota bacterium]|nr:hypothetical protein [Thermodesulfobacteriota bacterium]
MKIIILTGAIFLCVIAFCPEANSITTQEKVEQLKTQIDLKTYSIKKDEIIKMLGSPDKTQIFVGVYYLLYETDKNEYYLFGVDEHGKGIWYKKVDPNDPELNKLFNLKVDANGIPLDDKGKPIGIKEK